MPAEDDYLLYSPRHRAWWLAGQKGFTPSIDDAGHYTLDEVMDIAIAVADAPRPPHATPPMLSALPVRLADVRAIQAGGRACGSPQPRPVTPDD